MARWPCCSLERSWTRRISRMTTPDDNTRDDDVERECRQSIEDAMVWHRVAKNAPPALDKADVFAVVWSAFFGVTVPIGRLLYTRPIEAIDIIFAAIFIIAAIFLLSLVWFRVVAINNFLKEVRKQS